MVLMSGAALMGALGFLAYSQMHLHLSTPAIWALMAFGGVAFLAFMVLFTAVNWAAYMTAFAVIYNDQRVRVDGVPPAIAPSGVSA